MKSKIILFAVILPLLMVQCQKQDKKETMKLTEYKYKNNKRIVYGLDVSIPGPYEAYVNDVLVEKNNETSMHNTMIYLNQAILKSGTYNFRIKIFPTVGEEKGIEPQTLSFLKVGLSKYEKIPVGEGALPDTYQYIQSYPIAKIDKPIPFYEVTGEFKAEVPYEVEGWSKGQDLSKMDQKILHKKVVAYYQKLWNILNNGEGEQWENVTQKRRQELAIFHYSDIKQLEESINKEKKEIGERKGRMAPLEDYSMKIYGHGKLVTLERISHTKAMNGKDGIDAQGESPLIRNGKIKGVSFYPVKLYLPEGSNDFVIIRH